MIITWLRIWQKINLAGLCLTSMTYLVTDSTDWVWSMSSFAFGWLGSGWALKAEVEADD